MAWIRKSPTIPASSERSRSRRSWSMDRVASQLACSWRRVFQWLGRAAYHCTRTWWRCHLPARTQRGERVGSPEGMPLYYSEFYARKDRAMETIDTLLVGGVVLTMNQALDRIDDGAVAIRGDSIVAVGPAD